MKKIFEKIFHFLERVQHNTVEITKLKDRLFEIINRLTGLETIINQSSNLTYREPNPDDHLYS